MRIDELPLGSLLLGIDTNKGYEVYVYIKTVDQINNVIDYYSLIDAGYQIGIHRVLIEKEQWEKVYKEFRIANEEELHTLLVKISTIHIEAYIENSELVVLLQSIIAMAPELNKK